MKSTLSSFTITIAVFSWLILSTVVLAFTTTTFTSKISSSTTILLHSSHKNHHHYHYDDGNDESSISSNNVISTTSSSNSNSRRSLLVKSLLKTTTLLSTTCFILNEQQPQIAYALPMVKTSEFEILLKDSSKSIQIVEFAGPSSDIVTVILQDGTKFGISDIVESSTDPRSPLKLASTLRSYNVPTKFASIDAILSKTPKKKVSYMNSRVQEAAKKEKEKRIREQQDEEYRLSELRKIEQEQEQQQQQ